MSQPQLFVVVSTGERVANLPPLLEHASRGDQVLWIESAEARQTRWSDGPRAVVEARGLRNHEFDPIEIDDLNDPAEVVAALAALVPELKSWKGRVYFVANGGNKLTPIGVLLGLRELHPTLLYGDVKPAVHRVFRDTFAQRPEIVSYARHDLDLRDILALKDHFIANDCQDPRSWDSHHALRFWPGSLTPVLAEVLYGRDPELTCRLHAEQHAWGERLKEGEPVEYQHLAVLVPPQMLDNWRERVQGILTGPDPTGATSVAAIYDITRHLANEAARQRLARADAATYALLPSIASSEPLAKWQGTLRQVARSAGGRTETALERIYNLCREMAEHVGTRRVNQEAGYSAPSAKLGLAFEYAVARRVHAWLDSVRPKSVQSAWLKVKVKDESREVIEFDVLLVLKNGILLHLECKTFTVELKDLHARVLNLQSVGSQLAKMYVCGPLFTPFENEEWFASLVRMQEFVEGMGGLRFIPFTLPGQPGSYQRPDSRGVVQTRKVPTFEDGLRAMLQPYEAEPIPAPG